MSALRAHRNRTRLAPLCVGLLALGLGRDFARAEPTQFDPPWRIGLSGSVPEDLCVEDVDRDGLKDAVVVHLDDTLEILFGHPDFPLLGRRYAFHPVGESGPQTVDVGDLNQDGRPDIVAGSLGITVFFSCMPCPTDFVMLPTQLELGPLAGQLGGLGAFFVRILDVTDDEIPDVVVVHRRASGTNVSVFRGEGGGAFSPARPQATETPFPLSLDVGRVNNDGYDDLVIGTQDGAWLVPGRLPGGLTDLGPAERLTASGQASSVVLGDLVGSGDLDLAVYHDNVGTLSVLPGHGDGSFGTPITVPRLGLPFALAIHDVNGDRKPDLLSIREERDAAADEWNSLVDVYEGGFSGGFSAPATFLAGTNPSFRMVPAHLVVSDLNDDSRPDLVVMNKGTEDLSVLFNATTSASVLDESGTLRAEIEELKEKIEDFLGEGSLEYDEPADHLEDFRELARSIESGELETAATQAAPLGYEVVRFTDTQKNRTYVLLREQEQSLRGWGTYVYDPAGSNHLIEAPHPLHDENTPELAIDVYAKQEAKGFLMAGAHRYAQDDHHLGTKSAANVAGHTECVFHVVHEEWSDADTIPAQIHGFDQSLERHRGDPNDPCDWIPDGTDVVLSNGADSFRDAHSTLDDAFDGKGLLSFVYNQGSAENGAVNTDWRANGCGIKSGYDFRRLGATYNVQGKFTRASPRFQPFLHIEFERSVRVREPALWPKAVDAVVAALRLGVLATAAPTDESGSLEAEIARLKSLILQRQSDAGLYQTPTDWDLFDFAALAASVAGNDLDEAAAWARSLDYEFVRFTDEQDGRTYLLLREHLEGSPAQGQRAALARPRGWGSYVFDPEGLDVLIEAPHPLFETNTPEIAYEVFRTAGAKGFLIAGAHRANRDNDLNGESNVVRNTGSIFHVVHREWSDGDTLPVQVHGFSLAKHPEFPGGADAVLSNGDGLVPDPHAELDRQLDDQGLLSFVYNTLPAGDPQNALVNADWENGGVVPGTLFSPLAATLNVQGQSTRQSHGQPFLNVELEQSIRFADPALRPLAIAALAQAIERHVFGPLDMDRDGIPDDGDGSGIAGDAPCTDGETEDCDDNCSTIANTDQADQDSGGVGDLCDNCVEVSNQEQTDTDGDDIGNACDCDFNQDGGCGQPDYSAFIACFGKRVPASGPADDPTCEESDMNGDGGVGQPDYSLFIRLFGGTPGPSGTR